VAHRDATCKSTSSGIALEYPRTPSSGTEKNWLDCSTVRRTKRTKPLDEEDQAARRDA
jgi:hypothetical protein